MRYTVIIKNCLSGKLLSTLSAFVRPFSYKLTVEIKIPFTQVKK